LRAVGPGLRGVTGDSSAPASRAAGRRAANGNSTLPPTLQHTLARDVALAGIGVHSGRHAAVSLCPAPANAGITFLRSDVADRNPRIPARVEAVSETRLGTVIANADGVRVSTIEHLMAAFSGLGVDNALVVIDGPEMPILDGSCAPFVALIDQVGRRAQSAPRAFIEILEPVEAADGDKRAALLPGEGFELAFEILFDSPAIGRQTVSLAVDEAAFREDLADARTFGFLHEVEALRAAGLARGGSMDNVLVVDGGRVLNPSGLRRPDEFVRHKALDAIGDLYLLGAPLIGRYEGRYAGHALNNALARALLARPDAWRRTVAPAPLARAV
jgi:UDP-3-O-[3-hydroxymyristoyl] N-acetylglucosamine deacetylase